MRLINRNPARPGSSIALALALVAGTVVGAAALETPAYAAKKKAKAGKADYSKEFIAAYSPVDAMAKAEAPDWASIKAALPGVEAAVSTDDDKMAAGNLFYVVGRDSDDMAIQRKGVAMMLESGKVPAENTAAYTFLAGQLAYQDEDWAAARDWIKKAIAAGYTDNEPEAIIAEAYFNEDMYGDGLSYLKGVIDARDAAGTEIPAAWLRRGLTVAYQNDLNAQAKMFSRMYAAKYPSAESWGDAIAILRNTSDLDGQVTLDALRLARLTNGMRQERDYVDYVEAADFRRLPGEVKAIIDEGIEKGLLRPDDVYVAEALSGAKDRIATDQSDLPELEDDARNGDSLTTVMAAGDAFLSYSMNPRAEEFYAKALTLPGVDRDRTLTRLGIAQVRQGKAAEAVENFNAASGAYADVSALWAAYAKQLADAIARASAAAPAAQ
ncbi:hypothetical protein [Parerythrobacter aestuarii]|uniref:hypothetical protein n=1 Tax=Parerythrobacter aestuarii TaxID=3020909 RepID=UPI0024DE7799|nr:hypothetical protein [Parerythrobacter aestuarii]